MLESRQQYMDRISLFMPKELRPAFNDLVIPCYCRLPVCQGWRLKTFLRKDLHPSFHTQRPKRK